MNDRLEDLLAEFFEQCERDGALDAATFAAAHADVPGLAAALLQATDTDALLPSHALPTQIGPYRVLGEVGRGGTGRVLRVIDPRTPEVTFALKLLSPAANANPRALERFRREIEALRRIDHPCVITVHACGEHQGTPYLVMDLVVGESLAQKIARARGAVATQARPRADRLGLPGEGTGPQRAAALVAAVARAVTALHDAGLLHRDLKPSNVLMRTDDARPVLIDLGLAGDDDAATLTASGDVLGTPAFMAPEQARGEGADARTDVYGLGAILYELLTLEVPHPGTDPTQVMLAVQTRLPRPVRWLDPRVPPALAAAVRRAMAFRPARRYATANDFAAVLEALAQGRPAPRASLSLAARLEDIWRFRRRHLVVAALVVVTLVAAGALLAWRNQRNREAARDFAVATAAAWVARGDAALPARRLLEVDPRSELARYVLARVDGTTAAGPEPYFAALGAGEDALAKGDARAAVTHLQRAVDLRRDEPLGLALLGLAAARAGDLDRAARELAISVRLLPGSTHLLSELAAVQHRRKDDAEAVAAMQQAVAIAPDNPHLWRDLARMQNYAHDYEGGLVAIDRALALSGAEPPTEFLRVKGVMLDGLRRLDEAAAVMQLVVARAPTAEAWLSLGATIDRAHRIDEAAAAYEHALGIDPRSGRALLNLTHLHAGSDAATCAQCREFFTLHPALRDAGKVEAYALRALALDGERYPMVEALARTVARGGGSATFAAEVGRLLESDLPPDGLGRLLKAQRVLAGR